MKKILTTLAVIFAVLCAMPVWSCSLEKGIITGGACSIKELNNLEKSRNPQEKVNLNSKRERNLRPVRLNPNIMKQDGGYCVFGMCLKKNLLEK